MKKSVKTFTVLFVLLLIVFSSGFGVSNSFLSANKGMGYSLDRECDESISTPRTERICVNWKHHERRFDQDAFDVCKSFCNFVPNSAAQIACIAACHATSWTREWDQCIEWETIIIYPCSNSN